MNNILRNFPRKTGKWLCSDIPKTGWTCVEIEDTGSFCEMCEVTPIVYAHIMRHENYPLALHCGCVCAGFMAEDPAAEELRELLYKWHRSALLNRTPVEKLRRKDWHRTSYRWEGHVFGWQIGGRIGDSPVDNFHVEISTGAEGWRFHVYHPSWHTKIRTSEPFTSDILAATAGIGWCEMLMANPQWVASECETIAEDWAAQKAAREANDIRSIARILRDLYKRDDLAEAVEALKMSCADAMWAARGHAIQFDD